MSKEEIKERKVQVYDLSKVIYELQEATKTVGELVKILTDRIEKIEKQEKAPP